MKAVRNELETGLGSLSASLLPIYKEDASSSIETFMSAFRCPLRFRGAIGPTMLST
jgi:hypothetical protein